MQNFILFYYIGILILKIIIKKKNYFPTMNIFCSFHYDLHKFKFLKMFFHFMVTVTLVKSITLRIIKNIFLIKQIICLTLQDSNFLLLSYFFT